MARTLFLFIIINNVSNGLKMRVWTGDCKNFETKANFLLTNNVLKWKSLLQLFLIRGVVGVTYTTSFSAGGQPTEIPARTNYNLRGHRSEVRTHIWMIIVVNFRWFYLSHRFSLDHQYKCIYLILFRFLVRNNFF